MFNSMNLMVFSQVTTKFGVYLHHVTHHNLSNKNLQFVCP